MLICKFAAQIQTSKSCQPDPIAQLASGFPDDRRPPESHAQCTINLPGTLDTDDTFAVDAAEAVDKCNSVTTMGFSTDDYSRGATLHELSQSGGTWSAACSTPEGRLCQPDPVTQPAGGFPDDGRSPESHVQGTAHEGRLGGLKKLRISIFEVPPSPRKSKNL